jgi:hypothetical protein
VICCHLPEWRKQQRAEASVLGDFNFDFNFDAMTREGMVAFLGVSVFVGDRQEMNFQNIASAAAAPASLFQTSFSKVILPSRNNAATTTIPVHR